MASYKLAIEFKECDKKTKKFCLFKGNDKCVNRIYDCPYPMISNPLCTCKTFESCSKRWRMVKDGKRLYILYDCFGRCGHAVKEFEDAEKHILSGLENDDIYYGKRLKELLKKLFKDKSLKTDTEVTVDYFEKMFKVIRNRV